MADVQIVSVDVGAYTGSTHHPLIKVPNGYGGVSILEAAVIGDGAGTAVGLKLVTTADVSATGGTPAINGTVGAFAGTIVLAEGVVHNCTISTPFVDEDYWIGLDQSSGTAATNTVLSLSYAMGK